MEASCGSVKIARTASQMIKNISAIQKRQDDMEAELKQTTKRMNSIDMELKENKRDIEAKINDNK